MSFSIGIVGLPNVGKSTLFKALTKKKVEIASFPFTTIHPNFGVVTVSDQRLEKIATIVKPEKVTPTFIEFVDIAGLVKGAHKGLGLGNQFLAQIRNCDAIVKVIRGFEDPKVENVLGEVNPEKEIEILKTELLMKDLETLENLIPKIEKDLKKNKKLSKKFEILKKIKDLVSQGRLISQINSNIEPEIKEYQFLTQKPILYILNTDGKKKYSISTNQYLEINLKEEGEMSELSDSEIKEFGFNSKLDQLIKACYNILDLITFFTIAGGKEARAWTAKRGTRAPAAGGLIHSDFEKKFIRAEVISWQKLIEAGSRLEGRGSPEAAWSKARELGQIKTVGKDYIVEDGDVIEFKI